MSVRNESEDFIGISDGYTQREQYKPTKKESELVQRLKEMFQQSSEARGPSDQQWVMMYNYLRGQHLRWRDTTTGDIVTLTPRSARRLWSINNQFRPAARSLAGKLSKINPVFNVNQAPTDPNAIEGARAAEAILDYYWYHLNMNVKWAEGNKDVSEFGNSFPVLEWDPDAGESLAWCRECGNKEDVSLVDTDCLNCEANFMEAAADEEEANLFEDMADTEQARLENPGAVVNPLDTPPEDNEFLNKEIPKLVEVKAGDIRVDVYAPWNFFPDPGATCEEEMRCFFIAKFAYVSDIRAQFPQRGLFVESGTGEDAIRPELLFQNDSAFPIPTSDRALLVRYFEKPTAKYPDGRIICYANDVLLYEGPNYAYKLFGRHNVFPLQWTKNREAFFAESPGLQAVGRQRELNVTETVTREWAELVARPKVFSALNDRVSADELSPVTQQFVKYNPMAGRPPEVMRMPDMPQTVFARRGELKEDIQQQFALTSSEIGEMPTDPNGRAMAIAQAELDQQIGPVLTLNLSQLRALAKCILILARHYVDPEKKVTIVGRDNFYETHAFKKLKLLSDIDLRLEVDDGFSRNQAVRLNQLAQYIPLGLFNDPQTGQLDVARFASVAKVKIPGVGLDNKSSEYSAAQLMINKIVSGEQPQIGPEDDAVTFTQVFLHWLRTEGRGEFAGTPQREAVLHYWTLYTQHAMASMMPGVSQPQQMGPGQESEQSMPADPQRENDVLAQADKTVSNADGAAEKAADGGGAQLPPGAP